MQIKYAHLLELRVVQKWCQTNARCDFDEIAVKLPCTVNCAEREVA